MKWIIIDTRTKLALHGVNNITLQFSSHSIAQEVAVQFFKGNDFIIVPITLTA